MSESAGEQQWVVETIRMMLKDRVTNKEYFLVKWQDWPYSSMTWEPETNLVVGNSQYLQSEISFQRELYSKKIKISHLVDKGASFEAVLEALADQGGAGTRRRLMRHLKDFYVAEVHRKNTNSQALYWEFAQNWRLPAATVSESEERTATCVAV